MKRQILSLTINELRLMNVEDILIMLKSNMIDVSKYDDDYAFSIAKAIVKRIFLIKDLKKQYHKFYKIIFSDEFRNDKYIQKVFSKSTLSSLKNLFDIYDNDIPSLSNILFEDNEDLFDELIMSNRYEIKNIFSDMWLKCFEINSYKNFLSCLLKNNNQGDIVYDLIENIDENNKYIYMIALMDNAILKYIIDDSNYFNIVTTLLNDNNYRQLLGDYYDKYVAVENREINWDIKFNDDIPNQLKVLTNYTFNLMTSLHKFKRLPNIMISMDDLFKSVNIGKEFVHTAVFGVEGYKKFRNGTFDILLDFPEMDKDRLLNLKIAFFNTIYGITYDQVVELLKKEEIIIKNVEKFPDRKHKNICDIIRALKAIYDMKLEDYDESNLCRRLYRDLVKKNGVYVSIQRA